MDIIGNILKNIKFKTVLYGIMLFISSVLLYTGYLGVTKDKYINVGFSYLYICIIYFVIYIIMFIFNRNKTNIILTSVCFILCLILFIIASVKFKDNIELIYRYLFCLLSVISFICLFKTCLNFLKS